VGGVTLGSQVAGTLIGIAIAFVGGILVYGAIKSLVGLRLSEDQEYAGADLSIHKITAQPDYNRGEV
jgi:Amt family ammonium transporter